MKRFLTPKRRGLPRDYLPDRTIDRAVVRNRLAKAKLLHQEEKVVAFLDDALADYRRNQLKDAAVAWPGQVRGLLERIRSAALALKLTGEADGTILRATTVSPFAYADAEDTVNQLVRDLEALLSELGEPTKGGGLAVRRARQRRLAERFWGAFTTNNWPTGTSANSLMTQLLQHVLEVADDSRGTIKQLLEEVRPIGG